MKETKFTVKKKIMASASMLVVSAIMLSSATYAWFSMNKSVTVTGMEVTAKSNAKYLLVNDKNVAGEGETTKVAAYATSGNDQKKTYPTAYYTAAGTLNGHTVAADKWYTTTSNNPAVAVSGTDAITEVTEGAADYMLTYNAWLTLSTDSEPSTDKAIKVDFSLENGSDAATKAVVLIGSDKFAMDSTNNTATTSGAVSLSSTTTVPVTVYVYIDGNSQNVYSDYINTPNTITGSVSLAFTLVDVAP